MFAARPDPASFLSRSDRLWLDRACQRFGIPPRTWSRVPWLKAPVEMVAVEQEADRIQAERECGRLAALMAACSLVGVPFETHQSRMRRAVRYAFDSSRDEKFNLNLPPDSDALHR